MTVCGITPAMSAKWRALSGIASLLLITTSALAPLSVSAWDYTWDDPVLYDYCFSYDCYGYNDYSYGYGGYDYYDNYYVDYYYYSPHQYQYANVYQAYQSYYQSQYPPVRGLLLRGAQASTQTGQSQYQSQYSHFGYGQQYGYQNYGFSSGSPTGDTIPYVNEPICDYPGYGRYSCLYHPGQPIYDYWTGTWY